VCNAGNIVAIQTARVRKRTEMNERCDVYLADERVMHGASLRQAADLLNIEMFDLAVTILRDGRCMV
jgi:hypothetical protein